MATETQSQLAPEITIINRVAAIPLVASSLNTIHSTLTNNTYTRGSYAQAQGISKAALSYAEPIQKTFAPLITRADGFANMGLDAVESRYPYPFKTPTEDIMKDLKGRGDYAYDIANKTLDEKVKSPALYVAQGIDQMRSTQRFTPVVDYFQVAVQKIQPKNGTTTEASSEPPKYQYQRALSLSKGLSEQVYTYSTEQINQIKAQNVLVQRASDAAQRVTAVASSSYGAAQEKVHTLSDVMLQELHKVQASTSTLPSTVQASFHDITAHLSTTITELSNILTSPEPLPDRVHKVRDTVQERVQPLLAASAARFQEILVSLRGKAAEKTHEVENATNGNTNGYVVS
ncbi:hypothetical protein EUX98_g6656 [Antrodiella citrinella]|uniref:Lipid droplet-associated perilipin protein n=1 Tax=Antrodiella citrinella TaxID=2447956 RepID=A0A4S4MQ92_9APHY|nr:hypothetical protein EUX98_g6656 [Antrodiella citrinella]